MEFSWCSAGTVVAEQWLPWWSWVLAARVWGKKMMMTWHYFIGSHACARIMPTWLLLVRQLN